MPVTITHSTLADGTFSATGAAAWDANHAVSGLGTMAEQDANNVNITGGSLSGVTGVATSGTNSNITSLTGLTTPLSVAQGGSGTATPSLVAGSNISISGSWPNQTIATSGVLTSLTVNSTPTSGGAAGQIMFDTGSVLQESSNLVWDNTNKKLTITGATVTTSQPVLDMTQTWNNGSTVFTGIKLNITRTAANGRSTFLDFLNSGTSYFKVISENTGSYLAIDGSGTTYAGLYVGVPGEANSRGGISFYGSTSTLYLNFGPGGASQSDTFVGRKAAANLRFGAADAAAPVAQTLSVQSVVAGTSNTAGANLTITGSQGTGTGAGGSIIFQVAPAGSSGTAQNALATAMTIASDKSVTVEKLSVGGIFWNITYNGNYLQINDSIGTTVAGFDVTSKRFVVGTNNTLGWGLPLGTNSPDLILTRRAAANLRFGAADAAAPVAQTLSVQSVVAGTSNTAGANLTITGSQGTGTGAGGDIIFQTALAGSSGTAQNTLTTALRIYSNQTVAVGKAYTVATLPAAGTQGRRAWVTDATAPIFLGALTGGGAVVCPVFDNGAAWVAG